MKITRHTVPNFLNFTSSLLMLLFVQPLSVNSVTNCQALLPVHSDRMFIKILSSLLNGAMLTGSVRRNFHNLCYFWRPVWKTKSWLKKQAYRKTEACRLHSRVFWIFLPNVVKIDPYNFELYRFKVCAFFLRHSVVNRHWLVLAGG